MIDQQKNLKNTEFHLLQTTLAPFSAIQEKSLIDLELAENGASVVLVVFNSYGDIDLINQ